MPAADVAPAQYLGMTCQQLKNEKRRIATRQTDLAPSLVPLKTSRNGQTALSNEVKTIEKIFADNTCGIDELYGPCYGALFSLWPSEHSGHFCLDSGGTVVSYS